MGMGMGMGIDIDVRWYPVYDVCADESFNKPIANRRMGHLRPQTLRAGIHRPLNVYGVVGAYMAGARCPTPERLKDLVHDIADIEDWEKAAVRELFAQLSPQECAEFMISTDGSPREIARLMRVSGVRRGIVVNWVNQYSSDPEWREDTMLAIQYAERERRADRQPVSKVDGRVSTATGGKP